MELSKFTAHQLHNLLVSGKVSAREVVEDIYQKIQKVEEKTNCFITLTPDLALRQAEEVDRKIARGEEIPPLAGIPLAIKDVISTEGIRTTCGSRILANYMPPYQATVVERLKNTGILFIGKTNMDEFAMGSSTENSAFGPVRNPWDLERVPGGSSGGSAAAVAAGETVLALGTDTGGSIRQPASFCGIVGLKPTYGRVSRYGLVAFASSLDQIGPLTGDVTDCALLLEAISGHDARDSTSVDMEVPQYRRALVNDVKGMRIGIPREYFGEGMDGEVEESIWRGIRLLEKLGAEVEEVSLPHTEYAVATYYIIAPGEASSNLARYDGVQYGYRTLNLQLQTPDSETNPIINMFERTRDEGFGEEVKRRIMLGTYTLSAGYYEAYYLKAQKVRTLIKKDFEEVFKEHQVIITPTSPTPAFKIGEKIDDPLKMYLSDIYTISVNLAGLPAISIPCGFTRKGLPIGLQIIGKPFDEETILRVAYTFEQNTPYHLQEPGGIK